MLIQFPLAITIKMLNEHKTIPSSATCIKWLLRTKGSIQDGFTFSVAVYVTCNKK